jgi:hypothetical protein
MCDYIITVYLASLYQYINNKYYLCVLFIYMSDYVLELVMQTQDPELFIVSNLFVSEQ